jgi:hypothetical protein
MIPALPLGSVMVALWGWWISTKKTSLGSLVWSPLTVVVIVRVVCPGAKVSPRPPRHVADRRPCGVNATLRDHHART